MRARAVGLTAVAAAAMAGLAACGSCQPIPQPAPPPDDSRAAVVYQELIEAGCMPADPEGGVASIAGEYALGDAADSWLICLYADGGTIKSCAVPCGPSGASK